MSKIQTRFLFGGLLALTLVSPPVGGAGAGETTLPCVQRDLQLVTLVEESGNANAAAGQVLADATLAMVDARKSCIAGRVNDSLAQYDRIARDIMTAVADRNHPGMPTPGLARSARN
jgi:hypothetical protein